MALDPRIALAVQPTNISGAIQQGLEDRQAREMMPLQLEAAKKQNELLQAQAANTQQEVDKAELLRQATGAKYTMGALEQLKSLPPEKRMPVWQMHAAKLKAMNFNPDNIAPEDVTTDEGLARSIAVVSPYVSAAEKKLGVDTVGTAFFTKENGKVFSNVNTFNRDTGQQGIAKQQVEGEILQQGQTPQEKYQMAMNEAMQKSIIQTNALNQQALNAVITSGQKAGAEESAKTEVKKVEAQLDEGVEYKNALNDIAYTKALLEKINTGGLKKYQTEVAQFFNMDVPNESAFNSMANERILNGMQKLTGAASDKDSMIVKQAGFSFDIGNAGNRAILNRMEENAKRKIAKAQYTYNQYKKNGKMDIIGFWAQDYETPNAPPTGSGENPSNANPAGAAKPDAQETPEQHRERLKAERAAK